MVGFAGATAHAAAPHATQFGWGQSSTLLNRTLVERGVEHWGNDARLCLVRKRLAAGERITDAKEFVRADRLGAIGRGEGIAGLAVVLLEAPPE